MRRGATCLTILLAVLSAPAASAQTPTLPTGKAGDVIVKPSRGGLVISFHRKAAGAFKVIAGRRVDVACTSLGDDSRAGLTVQETSIDQVRAPERRRPFRSGLITSPKDDYCVVSRSRYSRRKGKTLTTYPTRQVAAVPLTQRGAVFLDERRKSVALLRVAAAADVLADQRKDDQYPPAAEIARKVPGTVALVNAAATPPPGRVGVFTSGANITLVTLSATGRRLYVETGDDERFSTNVVEHIFDED